MTHHRVHRVEVHPGHFRGLKTGARHHDVRKDEGYAEGQRILYQERDPGEDKLTGDEILMSITSMTSAAPGLDRGYVALSLAPVQRPAYVPGDLAEDRKHRDARGAEKL